MSKAHEYLNRVVRDLGDEYSVLLPDELDVIIKIARLEGAISAYERYSSATNIRHEMMLLQKELRELFESLKD